MNGLGKALLCSAAAVAVTMPAFIQSPSARNIAGRSDPAESSAPANAPAEMPNSVSAAAAAAHAKADAVMTTEPAVVPSPSIQNSGGVGEPAQPPTSGKSEMPNSAAAGSELANERASAAMRTEPNPTPLPFPTGTPASDPNLSQPK